MSALQKALEQLQPRDWSDVPHGPELPQFLRDTFSSAELIANSLPQPPNGSPFSQSTRYLTSINPATKASEIHPSSARGPDPAIPDLEGLRKGWGKTVKLPAKDTSGGMNVWKMAGHDRHGAWFARRSVHEGLGFSKWKQAMQKEFAQSLAVDGKPGEGSVRGIGADRRLEREVVDGVGKLEVYQLSAQFPGPVAPREFITCLITSDKALSENSAAPTGSTKQIPRHFMVVSIPVDHPEAPPRQSLVRGSYESIEMIREIPLTPFSSQSTPNLSRPSEVDSHELRRSRGLTVGGPDADTHSERTNLHGDGKDDPETNPVEWIMITRSDPGGGIPRFMVERNTPASIAADATKFLDWATSLDDNLDDEGTFEQERQVPHDGTEDESLRKESTPFHPAEVNGHLAGVMPQKLTRQPSVPGAFEPSRPQDSGIIASLTSAMQNYAPTAVTSRLGMGVENHDTCSDSDSDSSFNSFYDTTDYRTAHEGPRTPDPSDSVSSLNMQPQDTNGGSEGFENSSDQKHYDKEIKKLIEQRKTLDERMEKAREDEKKKQEELLTKEEKEQQKTRERLEKEKQKQEERYKKEMEKLEARREKEERRIEVKRQKAREKDAGSRDKREKDEYKRRVEILQRENELLRQQMGDLQRENTLLVAKVGKLSEGPSALRQVRDEIASGGRERATSVGSRKSTKSGESKLNGKSKLLGVDSPRASSSEEVGLGMAPQQL